MSRLRAQRFPWPLTVLASFGPALVLPACSGKVQQSSDCRSGSSCGGAGGASGGKAGAGSSAVAGSGDDSAAGSDGLEACSNGKKDADEADVDCGGNGRCERCIANQLCKTNHDCESNDCTRNHCSEPSCADKVKNQDESDVDCGGSCLPCDVGAACSANADCAGQYCAKRVCADHCLSGVRDADETDKDCGGTSCPACADDQRCKGAPDCQSLVCFGNSCLPATCTDQVKNQDETDLDCGGACRGKSPCPVGAQCISQADCESWLCSPAGKCLADIVVPPGTVIDDFEDDDLVLPASPALGGRVGKWYAYGDGTGTGTLAVTAINRGVSSVYGLLATGMGFNSWGSGFAVDLNNSGRGQPGKAPYDATGYQGVTFWARAQAATTLIVALSDVDTDAAGQTCTICDRHYYEPVQLSPNWQRFELAFSELVLEPGTVPAPTAFKPSGVVSLQFRLAPGQSYELNVDDVAFLK